MSEKFQRRDVLQSSTATILGLSAFSGEVLALETEQHNGRSSKEHEIPYDLSIINNSTEEDLVKVKLIPESPSGPAFKKSFSLRGLNESAVDNADLTRIRRSLNISGDGRYTVSFSRKDGSTASTSIRISEDGVDDAEAITVYIEPSGEVTADTLIR